MSEKPTVRWTLSYWWCSTTALEVGSEGTEHPPGFQSKKFGFSLRWRAQTFGRLCSATTISLKSKLKSLCTHRQHSDQKKAVSSEVPKQLKKMVIFSFCHQMDDALLRDSKQIWGKWICRFTQTTPKGMQQKSSKLELSAPQTDTGRLKAFCSISI